MIAPDAETFDPQRVFVGLFPGPAVQAAIDAHRRGWYWPAGSTQPKPHRLHLTLHFFGSLGRAERAALQQALLGVGFDPFTLLLSRPALWPHNRVAVLQPEECAQLRALHARTADAIRRIGLATAPDWQPHVTLGRRAAHANPPDAPLAVRWAVDTFVLVVSHREPLWRYDVLARYPAGG